jgi:hypothetical protein
VELKRMEHERQRLLQRKMFENQMRALEQQQQQELLSIPSDQQVAVSAPTTPPRQNGLLPPDGAHYPVGTIGTKAPVDVDALSTAVGSVASEKRKSVRYAPDSPEMMHTSSGFARIGHKSMPASRRTSASEHDEDLAGHLQNLSLIGERGGQQQQSMAPSFSLNGGKFNDNGMSYGSTYNNNAGVLLDEQLDQEMHSTSDATVQGIRSCD